MDTNLITEIADIQAIKKNIGDVIALTDVALKGLKKEASQAIDFKGLTDVAKNVEKVTAARKSQKAVLSELEKVELAIKKTDEFTLQNKFKIEELLSKEVNTIAELTAQNKALENVRKNLDFTDKNYEKTQNQIIAKENENIAKIKEFQNVEQQRTSGIGKYEEAIKRALSTDGNYKTQLLELRNTMASLEIEKEKAVKTYGVESKEVKALTEQYDILEKKAGEVTDKQGDMQARIKYLADDYGKFKAVLSGVQVVMGAVSVGKGFLSILGLESSAVDKATQKLAALVATMQGLKAIQETLNEDNYFMQFLKQIKPVETGINKIKGFFKGLGTAIAGVSVIVAAFVAAIALGIKMIKDVKDGTEEYEKTLKEDRARKNYIDSLKKMAEETKNLKTQTEQATTSITNFDEAISALNASTANGIALNNDFFNSIVRQGMASSAKKAIELMNEYLILQDKLKNDFTGGEDDQRVKAIEEEMGNLFVAVQNSKENAEALIKVLSGGSITGVQTKTLSYFQKIIEMSKKVQGTSVTPTQAPAPAPTPTPDATTKKAIEQTSAYADVVAFLSQDLIKLNENEKKVELTRIKQYSEALKAINAEFKAGDEDLYIKKIEELDENFAEMENAEKIKGMNDELEVYLAQVERLNDIMQRGQIVDEEEINSAISDLQGLSIKIMTLRGEILKLTNEKINVKVKVDDEPEVPEIEELKSALEKFSDEVAKKIGTFSVKLKVKLKLEPDGKEGEDGVDGVEDDLKRISDSVNEVISGLMDTSRQVLNNVVGNAIKMSEAEYNTRTQAAENEANIAKEALETSLLNEEDRAEAEVRIEKEKQRKLSDLKNEQAKKERDSQAAEIAINAVMAFVSTLATAKGGMTAKLVQAAAVSAVALSQLAVLYSKPLPKYEKGGVVGSETSVIAGEKGRELAFTPDNKVLMLDSKGIYNLPTGTIIKDNKTTEKILKEKNINISVSRDYIEIDRQKYINKYLNKTL